MILLLFLIFLIGLSYSIYLFAKAVRKPFDGTKYREWLDSKRTQKKKIRVAVPIRRKRKYGHVKVKYGKL